MDNIVRAIMCQGSSADAARRKASASNYITDTNFTNLLQNIDPNSPKTFNYSVFAAFNGIAPLRDQVKAWIQFG